MVQLISHFERLCKYYHQLHSTNMALRFVAKGHRPKEFGQPLGMLFAELSRDRENFIYYDRNGVEHEVEVPELLQCTETDYYVTSLNNANDMVTTHFQDATNVNLIVSKDGKSRVRTLRGTDINVAIFGEVAKKYGHFPSSWEDMTREQSNLTKAQINDQYFTVADAKRYWAQDSEVLIGDRSCLLNQWDVHRHNGVEMSRFLDGVKQLGSSRTRKGKRKGGQEF